MIETYTSDMTIKRMHIMELIRFFFSFSWKGKGK